MINNIYAIILIFIYIMFIIVLNLYFTIIKKNKYEDIDEKAAVMLYTYGKVSPYKLFKVTCMDLINKKYFTIKKEDSLSYIKVNNTNIDSLCEYEKLCYNSLKELIDDGKSLEELDNYFSTSYAYGKVLNKFYLELKKEVTHKYGRVYKYASFIPVVLTTFIYGIQVFSVLKIDIPIIASILLSLLLIVITVLVTNILNIYIKRIDFKRYLIIIVASLALSIISFNLWNKSANNDYLILHVILGIFSFLYPLYLYTCIYLVRSNFIYLNKKQASIIKYLDKVKDDLQNKKKYNKEDYILLYGLDIKKRIKGEYLK